MKNFQRLLGSVICTLGCVTSVYAANPASREYVNTQIQNLQTTLQTQISNLPAGTIYTAGSGISIVGTTISATGTTSTYVLGQQALGGTVIYVNSAGTHGLVAANQDQAISTTWGSTAGGTDGASNDVTIPANFDSDGQVYTDWHLPSIYELTVMCNQSAFFPGGSAPSGTYWSVSMFDTLNGDAYALNFSACGTPLYLNQGTFHSVRAVRVF